VAFSKVFKYIKLGQAQTTTTEGERKNKFERRLSLELKAISMDDYEEPPPPLPPLPPKNKPPVPPQQHQQSPPEAKQPQQRLPPPLSEAETSAASSPHIQDSISIALSLGKEDDISTLGDPMNSANQHPQYLVILLRK
jgi:hypothetical protein